MSDMWLPKDQDPRTQGNPQGEKATYVEYLANYRLTLGMKCDGLSPEQVATRSVPPSTMSLLGLVRHMARVENSWFQRVAQANGQERIYWSELPIPGHPDWGVVSIRDLIVHMIEEYARHCGHADLLRETIDGRTGQ